MQLDSYTNAKQSFKSSKVDSLLLNRFVLLFIKVFKLSHAFMTGKRAEIKTILATYSNIAYTYEVNCHEEKKSNYDTTKKNQNEPAT